MIATQAEAMIDEPEGGTAEEGRSGRAVGEEAVSGQRDKEREDAFEVKTQRQPSKPPTPFVNSMPRWRSACIR